MFNLFRNFKMRCRIIAAWLPIIWNDYDWDYHYILVALKHKITQTRKELTRNDLFVGVEKEIQNMLIAEHYIDRIINGSSCRDSPLCFCKKPKDINDPMCEWCQHEGINNGIVADDEAVRQCFEHIGKHIQRWWD